MSKAKRTSAAYEAKNGFEILLDLFERVQEEPPDSGITHSSRRKENERTAKRIALGVDKLQDAVSKLGLECLCHRAKSRTLQWVCGCTKKS